jgi:hypothetical protein
MAGLKNGLSGSDVYMHDGRGIESEMMIFVVKTEGHVHIDWSGVRACLLAGSRCFKRTFAFVHDSSAQP